MNESMKIGPFTLVNAEKVTRAIHGTVVNKGKLMGGLDKLVAAGKLDPKDENAYNAALLAEYDRLGGLVTKNGLKVVTGSFYDFLLGAAKETPETSFLTNIDGELLEVSEEDAKSLAKAKEKVEKLKKSKKKKKSLKK